MHGFVNNQTSFLSQAARLAPVARSACAYLVGRDLAGHWLAVETHGLGGGIFASCEAALRFARSETARRPGAVQMASVPIALP